MKRINKIRYKPFTEIGRSSIGLSLAWLLLLFAGSCTRADVEEDVISPHVLKDVDAGFNLNVLANRTPVTRSITFTPDGTIESDTLAVGVKDSIQTKAAASLSEVQESQIASLWVGQYDAATGKRLFNRHLSSMTGNKVNLKLKQNQKGSKSRVYFVSNAGDLGAIADEAALKKHTLAYASTAAGLPDNNLCKMIGTWEGEVVADGVKDITVELTRFLARITFTYSMGPDFAFTPTSVDLKNAPTLSQVEAPKVQLTTEGLSYKTYTGTASQSGATVYWYLPENMAGIASGANAVDSEKKKTGKGVTNATCIELTGNAVQGGVTYKNVTFRFYPGSDKNNYDILRNAHYTMTVSLAGIDVSDERITVGEIPTVEVDPNEMPAKKGGEKDIQITARPDQPWEFDMPDWLSALLDGKEIPSGATITYRGSDKVVFKAVEANPKAEKRSVSFNIDVNGVNQEIKIVQAGSTLIKGSNVSLAALADAEGSSSFTATEGLQWSAALEGGAGWLGWSTTNPGTSGSEASAGARALKVKATASNPSASQRSGKITVKAGASVGDAAYTGLKQEIAVNQAGSTVMGSTLNNIVAKGATGDASFTATKGLAWVSSITSGNWITLNAGGSGALTTGSAQLVNYTAAVNPSSTGRSGTITVRAGDTSSGPTGNILINQNGATLSVGGDKKTVAATASTENTFTFTATEGLSWNVGVASTDSWLSLTGTTSGTHNTTDAAQTITYSAVANPDGSPREGTITVKVGNAVGGTDAGLTKTISITQSAASEFTSLSGTDVDARIGADGMIRFMGAKGLGVAITFPSWITSTGIVPTKTTGVEQIVDFITNEANPSSTERTGQISVKVGSVSKAIAITQVGSRFTVDKTEIEVEATATSGSIEVEGTEGLELTVSPLVATSGITPTTNSFIATGRRQTLRFNVPKNTGGAREVTFIVEVTGSDLSKTIKVKQKAGLISSPITLTIDQSVLTGYRTKTTNMTKYPPFNYEGTDRLPNGSSFNGSTVMTGSYTIQVEKGQRAGVDKYTNQESYCSGLNEDGLSGWRIPTQIELYAIYKNKAKIEGSTDANKFPRGAAYWSSSIYNRATNHRCGLDIGAGGFGEDLTSGKFSVRCVRDK